MSFSKLQDDVFNLPLDLFQALYDSMGVYKKLTDVQLLLRDKAEKETDDILIGNPLEEKPRDSVFTLTNPIEKVGKGVCAVVRWALDNNINDYESMYIEWKNRNPGKDIKIDRFHVVMCKEKKTRTIIGLVTTAQKSA